MVECIIDPAMRLVDWAHWISLSCPAPSEHSLPPPLHPLATICEAVDISESK
jgi:hypothetical protein